MKDDEQTTFENEFCHRFFFSTEKDSDGVKYADPIVFYAWQAWKRRAEMEETFEL